MCPHDSLVIDKLGYTMQHVGVNQIKITNDIMGEAGFSGYTNHCFRATAVSIMLEFQKV